MTNPLEVFANTTNNNFLQVWNALHWALALGVVNLLFILAAFLRIRKLGRKGP
jgi:hypothetical protein